MKINYKKITVALSLLIVPSLLSSCTFSKKEKEHNNDNNIVNNNSTDNDKENTDDNNNNDVIKSLAPDECDSTFRISQFSMDVDKQQGIAKIYNIKMNEGRYDVTVAKIIRKENDYIEPNDVAAYVQAFQTWPNNYKSGSKKQARKDAINYGPTGRLVSTYHRNPQRVPSYCKNMGPWMNQNGGEVYYELDVSTDEMNPNYNTGSSLNRGPYRIVFFPGSSQKRYVDRKNGNESVCVFTNDHYQHFYEYYNYYNGWGKQFIGDTDKPDNTRPNVKTINLDEYKEVDFLPINSIEASDIKELEPDTEFIPETSVEKMESSEYRIPQNSMEVDEENGVARLYKIDKIEDNRFSKRVVRILREENEYIHANDVAAYIQAFKKAPSNYKWGGDYGISKSELEEFGTNARFKFTYYTGEYHRNDYTPNLGPWFEKAGLPYYEFDIADENHTGNYPNSRGKYRIVMTPGESQYRYVNDKENYEFDNVCFYTDDHYRSFREYYNYYNGWSSVFDGYKTEHGPRPNPITINNI